MVVRILCTAYFSSDSPLNLPGCPFLPIQNQCELPATIFCSSSPSVTKPEEQIGAHLLKRGKTSRPHKMVASKDIASFSHPCSHSISQTKNLLNVVSDRVNYNSHGMDEFVPQRTSAYISQYDLHLGEMTVREMLTFSARCEGVGTQYGKGMSIDRGEYFAYVGDEGDDM